MKVFMVQSANVFQKILLLHYVPNLEFGVYDCVTHCNIRIKDSVLIYEKLNFVSVVYMLKGFKKRNLKRVNLVNQRASRKNKLRQQILRGKKMPKMTNYLKKKIIYMFLEKFKYILVFRCILCHFNHWLF